jgi:hypothetical protein
MKIKSNIRAGSGGASGAGKNSGLNDSSSVVVVAPPPAPVVYYPVTRCAGI